MSSIIALPHPDSERLLGLPLPYCVSTLSVEALILINVPYSYIYSYIKHMH